MHQRRISVGRCGRDHVATIQWDNVQERKRIGAQITGTARDGLLKFDETDPELPGVSSCRMLLRCLSIKFLVLGTCQLNVQWFHALQWRSGEEGDICVT
jgi:hypothetical protein